MLRHSYKPCCWNRAESKLKNKWIFIYLLLLRCIPILQLVSFTTYIFNENWQLRNFMILILIFIMDFCIKKKQHWFGTIWLAKVWQCQCLSRAFQHVIYAMFLPVKRKLLIFSGKTAIEDCLLCFETEKFLVLWPSFSAADWLSIYLIIWMQ